MDSQAVGLILVGPSGSGKTWLQRQLVSEHGFWSPLHVTTREVDETDFATEHLPTGEFLAAVKAGKLAAPMRFGANWHAWSAADFKLLLEGRPGSVAVCLPFEAIYLSAFQPRLLIIWLKAPEKTVVERIYRRATHRDREDAERAFRRARDLEAEQYLPLIPNVVSTETDPTGKVLEIYRTCKGFHGGKSG